MKGLKSIIEQWASLCAAGVAAACCLGIPVILSTLTTLGLGFLIKDAYLLPIFAFFVTVSISVLYTSSQKHGDLAPFWIGLIGGVLGTASLWLLVTGIYALPALIYVGLGILVSASIWDFINGRRKACKIDVVCETNIPKTSAGKKIAKGVGISIAAAGVFYGMYKSVEASDPANQAKEANIACWGINACKGKTACSTAFNACTGMNTCKGRGYLYVSEKECKERSGVPLKGSEGDPSKVQ